MTDNACYVHQIIANIKVLQKLKNVVDPASGMAVSVRRGVARDNDDIENDHERRPWTLVEMGGAADDCGGIRAVIDQLIANQLDSLRGWAPSLESDVRALTAAATAARAFLDEPKP